MTPGRYIRQTSLAGFGPDAQQQLRASRVLIVGLGGLGVPVAQYLNAMGVGTLGLADQDIVELHNLQRQVIYTENHIGRPKIEVMGIFLRAQNSGTEIREHDTFLSRNNALDILAGYDVIVDATDNFPSRYLINDACIILKKPFVYGALHGFEGQVSVFNYQGGPTYRCLYPVMPGPQEIPDCNQHGVLGVLPGIVGTLQALEVVKTLTGVGEVLSGKLLLYNGLDQSVRKINYRVNAENLQLTALKETYGMIGCAADDAITVGELIRLLENNIPLRVIDVRKPAEFADVNIPGAENIPLQRLADRLDAINTGIPLYFVCATGKRSLAALQFAKERIPGIAAFNVEGGMEAYNAFCP